MRQPGWPSCAIHEPGWLAGPELREPTVVIVMPVCSSACAVGMRYEAASASQPPQAAAQQQQQEVIQFAAASDS